MAAVTLACRCDGYFLFSRTWPSPFFSDALAHLPGCIFIAHAVPALLQGTPAGRIGAAVTVKVGFRAASRWPLARPSLTVFARGGMLAAGQGEATGFRTE